MTPYGVTGPRRVNKMVTNTSTVPHKVGQIDSKFDDEVIIVNLIYIAEFICNAKFAHRPNHGVP